MIQFLENLFKFKAETIFNRRNIQHILRIKNFFSNAEVGQINKNWIIE